MHGGAWYVKPSQNGAADFTPTWAVGTANASFPIANVLTLEPDVVAKANENTATLRLTAGVAKHLVGLLLFNVSFPGITVSLTNNAGMATQTKTVPSPEDGLTINAFFDLDGIANTTATQWNLAVVGARPVAIGTVIPVYGWTETRVRWDMDFGETFPMIEQRSGHKKRFQYRIPVRYRTYTATPFYAEDRNAIRTLRREAKGSFTAFGFVPDRNDVDVILAQFSGEDHREHAQFTDGLFTDDTARGVVEMPITLEEVSSGIALL